MLNLQRYVDLGRLNGVDPDLQQYLRSAGPESVEESAQESQTPLILQDVHTRLKMVRIASTLVAGLVGLASMASAHPGHDVKAEAAERAAFIKRTPLTSRSLAHCGPQLKARGLERANIARRRHAANNLRRKRGLGRMSPPPALRCA